MAMTGARTSAGPAAPATGQPPVPARLLATLDRLATARVAVVSGPAGHDKHRLVDAWLDRQDRARVVRVDGDGDATRCVADALDAGTGPVVAVADAAAPGHDPATVPQLLDLATRQPRLRLLLVGRCRPTAPLGPLAARGMLVDVDATQLAWTRRDLAENAPDLADDALDEVLAATGGWPAMARLWAAGSAAPAPTGRLDQLVDGYLAAEVLAGLDAADVTFLQEVSVLPSLDPLGAAWMTGRGEAAAQLSRLQAQGVPITWDDANTIRLNPLLRGHLRRRLAAGDPARLAALAERAALWLRTRHRTVEAVGMAMDAGLVDLAWMLTGEHLTVVLHTPELGRTLTQVVGLLPRGWEADTVCGIVRALATPEAVVAQLGAIDPEGMVASGDTGRLGYVCLVLGMLRRCGYPPEVDATLALRVAGEVDARALHELDMALAASMYLEHGLWLMHHGELDPAREALTSALGIARIATVPWVLVMALGGLAMVAVLTGAHDRARRFADEALRSAAEGGFTTDALDELALLALSASAVDDGDPVAAGAWLARLEARADRLAEDDALRTAATAMAATADGRPQESLAVVGAYRDHPRHGEPGLHALLVARGAFDAALALGDLARARDEFGRIAGCGLPDQVTGRPVQQARLAMAESRPQEALDLLGPLADPSAHPFRHARHVLHLLVVLAAAADELGQPQLAAGSLGRAEVLSHRMGLSGAHPRRAHVATSSSREAPLTAAEQNVLAHLDAHRTLAQTAEALFISPNTLKTHLRRIYRKLGVSGRDQALERARVLGLYEPAAPGRAAMPGG